ncbi:uncharacterized protein LOC120358174 [Solenopsis invicta]|uniref:uncharacterized protein LOC120358174 n=1 Tax=Solenopsis invicta TaxID=13686 RepID=UPI00193D0A7F|nr:uncharacterized protein LOC120358174 [Solenopsis invicta]XP_039307181.1 uncharacterized protein LOC120358174 [Solenopsis invicta]
MGKKVSASMRVCSLHFTKEDFIPSQGKNHIRHLKKTSIPSLNLPIGSTRKISPQRKIQAKCREERWHKRSCVKQLSVENICDVPEKEIVMQTTVSDKTTDQNVIEKALPAIRIIDEHGCLAEVVEENVKTSLTNKDIGIQVQSDNIFVKFSSIIISDTELSTLTGIYSFSLLNTIETLVKTTYKETPTANTKTDIRETIIMTFMKLKQNMSYALLSILFKCKPNTCKEKIFQMLDILYICLKPAILWPNKDNILKNISLCFMGFEDVRVVVDCTEIKIQKPKDLCCQIATFSRYKSNYTIKFMTGVTPAGLILFVSKCYGGRAFDKAIFEQSKIIQKLNKKDAIMRDKGFPIDDICKLNDIKLIRPPFLKDKKQFSKTDAILTRNIATARVHIERSNQRLKTFQVLGSTMPACLISKADEIFNIICAVVNLSAPIIKDDKFCSQHKAK